MKRSDSKLANCMTAVSCAVLLFCLAGTGYCQDDGVALMLEMAPETGGYLNVIPGVHSYEIYEEVTLKATPNPGYQFVYWIGDVVDATASTTVVFLDSPKIVIAVFERAKFAFAAIEERSQDSAGRGGLIDSAADYSNTRSSPGGGRRPPDFHWPKYPEINDDTPVPENGNDVPIPDEIDNPPIPVPEPTTLTLVLAGMFMFKKYGYRRTAMHHTRRYI